MFSPTDKSSIPIAIVGMACRLPGAANLDEYWDLLVQGRSAIAEVPPDRLDRAFYFDPQKGVRGRTYSTKAGLLADRTYHRDRCPLPNALVESVDNTHLVMTEVVADALRHAGYDPFRLAERNTAVFIGHAQGSRRTGDLAYCTYLEDAVALLESAADFRSLPLHEQAEIQQSLISTISARIPPGPDSLRYLTCNMIAGTIAKAFGLTGSWLALNSACASSLHAMLLGARALQRGRAEMVIVGGASDCKTDTLVLFSNAQTLSTTESRPFDADADGLIISEGYVSLVMKTLDRALADGDPIQAVIRGLGVATDGRGKSLWAPRKEGQMKAMRRAYRNGVEMKGLQYLECHATATQVGDATELETISEVLQAEFPLGKRIPITSVKANIGHALEAAGIAGMIKTVLCMQHRTFPPAINIRKLNPKVRWDSAPFFVPREPAVWESPIDGTPRRAAVNAFGIGGLNMHVVIDEYVPTATPPLAHSAKQSPAAAAESVEDRAVAVIGMGCILPGASDLAKLWQVLSGGGDPKCEPPADRWSERAAKPMQLAGCRLRGGFITDYQYDWRKHKVPPKQVAEADPLQFMLLDGSEQALADSGYDRSTIDREHCGVVVGTEFRGDFSEQVDIGLRLAELQFFLDVSLRERRLTSERISSINRQFAEILLRKWPALVDESGSFTSSTLASRISKTLDLAGGAVAIDSGSTSALAALSTSIDSLLSGDTNVMICAAGQRHMSPAAYNTLRQSRLLASNDASRSILDADYDGVVPGEGVGAVMLKRLGDARRDNDRIHAVIRGIGAAHHSSSAEAMRLAMTRACAMAGVTPADIGFIEIDTDENDVVSTELLANLATDHAQPARLRPIVLSSATAQFGQLGGAGPMVALLKAGLELQQGRVTPAFGLRQVAIALHDDRTAQPAFEITEMIGRRLGAVVSWSRGQAYYLILDDGKPFVSEPAKNQIVKKREPFSPAQADTPTLRERANRVAICRFGAASLEDLQTELTKAAADPTAAWSHSTARKFIATSRVRLAIVADGAESLGRKLQVAVAQFRNVAARQVLEQQGIFCREVPEVRPRIAFVFPGQGSQHEGMLHDLISQSPAAARAMADGDAAMRQLGYPSFAELAWNVPTQLGTNVWHTQAAMLLADVICLAAVRECGIEPDLVLGNSYGEFPALYAAGVWDLPTVIRMTRVRCEGIDAIATGDAGLLATSAAPDVIKRLIASAGCQAYLANFNAPDQTVVGGRRAQLQKLATALEAESHVARVLAVPAAFHTPLMAGAGRLLQQALQTAEMQTPRVAMMSTVDNRRMTEVADIRRNLGIQLTQSVRYSQLIGQLADERPTVFIEVGPQQTLTKLNRSILPADAAVVACDNPKRGGLESILGIRALVECLGLDDENTPTSAGAPASVATIPSSSASVPPSLEIKPSMDDDIPHFDATERRRARMRNASDGQSPPGTHGHPKHRDNGHSNGHSHANGSNPLPTAARNGESQIAPSPPIAASPTVTNRVVLAMLSEVPSAKPAAAATPVADAKPEVAGAIRIAELESFLVNFVVEQTGYPAEVVELDADLEADLGIDSIKKAQLFGELVEYFDVGTASSGISLDEFPTLRHVLNFLAVGSAATPAAVPPAPAVARMQAVAAAKTTPHPDHSSVAGAACVAELESFLVNFVVEQTGYPAEVVDLDADLEADLGIDSIKKAQLFGELVEYFDVGTVSSGISLDEFATLRHVLDFLAGRRAVAPPPTPSRTAVNGSKSAVENESLSSGAPAPAVETRDLEVAPAASSDRALPARGADLERFLIRFVVEQTGYPAEVVDLDADLEADLGIDSIKKAQLFGELQEYFDVGTTSSGISLDDFASLRNVLDFLNANTGEASSTSLDAGEVTEQAGANSAAVERPFVVEGSPYELGAQHGRRYQEVIRRILRTYPELVDQSLEELPGSSARRSATTILTADELDELQGIADGVEVPLANILVHHFAVSAIANEDVRQQVIDAAESDSGRLTHVVHITPPSIGALELAIVRVPMVRKPTRGLACAAVAAVGTVHLSAGVNSAGLSIAISDAGGATSVARALLEQATDLEAALRIAGRHTAQPWSGCLCDRRAVRWAGVEFDGRLLSVHSDDAPITLATPGIDGPGVTIVMEPESGDLVIRDTSAAATSERCFHCADLLPDTADESAGLATDSSSAELSGDFCVEASAADVTRRFCMTMREAPLPADAPTKPIWSGSAIVLGCGSTAAALARRMTQSGATVHRLSPRTGLETLLGQLEQICRAAPATHLFITSGRDDLSADLRDEAAWTEQRQAAMELPLLFCQKWLSIAAEEKWLDRCSLTATTALGGDFGFTHGATAAHGGAVTGLLKGIFIEFAVMRKLSNLRVKVIDTPEDALAEETAEQVLRELASGSLDYEVAWNETRRSIPTAAVEQVAFPTKSGSAIRRGAVWVVTGGARGITAACALELGRRYGLKLHLIGSTPLPTLDPSRRNLSAEGLQQLKSAVMIAASKSDMSAPQAWENVQKEIEIDRSMRALAEAGVEIVYHRCDVSDRASLQTVLDDVRRRSGPIEGVLHGAGIDRSCRFEKKRPDVVRQTFGAKVDGAAHLMALTQGDPVRHFIGFGSISGRFGSFGQADYCSASDMLCKLIGDYRRRRPWIKAVVFHWHPWDDVGMAARPETKIALQGKSDLVLMPAAEGVAHLIREIEAGVPQAEVLITERRHWERFAAGVGRLMQTHGADAVSQPSADAPATVTRPPVESPPLAADESQTSIADEIAVELRTHRCQIRLLSAPLPAAVPAKPVFAGPVWILGDNDAARTLRRRLQQDGVSVKQINPEGELEQILATVEVLWNEQPAQTLFLLTGRDAASDDLLTAEESERRRQEGIIVPYFVAQRWYQLLQKNPDSKRGTLAAAVSLGGDFGFGGKAAMPDGGGVAGFVKSAAIEDSRHEPSILRCKVIDMPAAESPAQVVDALLRELSADEPEVEVSWTAGERRVLRPIPTPLASQTKSRIPRRGVWVVTGGARGITAVAAREMARRYGWKLHLLGKSPAPLPDAAWRNFGADELKTLKNGIARDAVAAGKSPGEAWDRVLKDIEIYDNLRLFNDAGVEAAYHPCDVADRQAVERVLGEIRRCDGPITGILHGAGIIEPGRFEHKRPAFVERLVRAKFDGLLNLLALTREDPLTHCIGFGSISGRFGGNGLSDYAAGNDSMAKVLDWFRGTHPECTTLCVHWESWEGSGMATLPRFAWGPRAVMNMKYMMPEEGVRRLAEELAAGAPDAEVLYTFGDFYPMFYPHEQRPLGPFMPTDLNSSGATLAGVSSLIRNLRRADDGTLGELSLDPVNDVFLAQHRLRGKPLLPVVISLEAIAVAAAAESRKTVVGFRNVELIDGLLFQTDRPVVAQVSAKNATESSVECRLSCDFRNRGGGLIQKDRPYLRAEAILADVPHLRTVHLSEVPQTWEAMAYPEESAMYHGAVLRCLTSFHINRHEGWGRLVALPLEDLVGTTRAGGWRVPSCVLDAAMVVCGCHVWLHAEQAVSLPQRIDQVELGRLPRDGEACLAYFRCREIGAGSALYDLTVVGADHTLIVQATGFRKVILPRGGSR